MGQGYYEKKITENDWSFHSSPELSFDSSENKPKPFDPTLKDMSKLSYAEHHRDDTTFLRRLAARGKATKHDSKISFNLKDFNPFVTDAEPCTLEINYPGEPTQYLKIHVVDAWGLHHNLHDHELVGTVDGEPKALVGTLVLTEDQKKLANNPNSPIGAYLKEHLQHYNEKTKAIPIIADNGIAVLRFGNHKYNFERKVTDEEISRSFYMKKAMDPLLQLDTCQPQQYSDLLDRNQKCLAEIQAIHLNRHAANFKFLLEDTAIRTGRPLADGFFRAVYHPDDPTYAQAVKDVRVLFKAHMKAITHSRRKPNTIGYNRALKELEARINEIKDKIHEDARHHVAETIELIDAI